MSEDFIARTYESEESSPRVRESTDSDTNIATVVAEREVPSRTSSQNKALIEQLIKDSNEKIMRYTLKLTGNNYSTAEDLVQEAYGKLIERIGKMNDTNLEGWMYTRIKNDYFSQRRHAHVVSKNNGKLFQRQIAEEESADRVGFINEGVSPKVESALNELPENFRKTFEAYVELGTYLKVVESEQIPLGTAKSRILRARQILQEKLKNYRQAV